jgi:2-dehydro-3-deoxyphosphogluconate aldolase/(4S)-4-hydroxy-2-oxoglutarate aldolase
VACGPVNGPAPAVFSTIFLNEAGVGADAEIGVGAITCEQEAVRAQRGADYLVTVVVTGGPRRRPAGVPVFPGGLTPTELLAGMQAGATAVKLFPASTVGPGYLGQLRGPFPHMQVIPSGGIGVDDAADWIAAGALAVSLGGPLLRDAFTGGDLAGLTARAGRLSSLVAEAVHARGTR